MSLAHRISLASLCAALTWFTGCCTGPMICPNGACGPLAFGNSCPGCDECDGCGELYIDPWINHPADSCDPCDKCGNFNGQSCGKCRSVFSGFPSLWGYRYRSDGCDGCGSADCGGGCHATHSGCDSCDGGCAECLGMPMETEIHLPEVPKADGQVIRIIEPTPAGKVIVSSPHDSRYQPHRSREIFRNRQEFAIGDDESVEY